MDEIKNSEDLPAITNDSWMNMISITTARKYNLFYFLFAVVIVFIQESYLSFAMLNFPWPKPNPPIAKGN